MSRLGVVVHTFSLSCSGWGLKWIKLQEFKVSLGGLEFSVGQIDLKLAAGSLVLAHQILGLQVWVITPGILIFRF